MTAVPTREATLASVQIEPTVTPTPGVVAQPTAPPTATHAPDADTDATASPEPTVKEQIAPASAPPAIACRNDSEFVRDVTIRDNTKLAPGEAFVKTWRLRNTGSCTWTDGYQLAFQRGNRMASPESVALERDVAPKEAVDISVPFTAPDKQGKHRSQWRMRAPDGTFFGTRPYVQIRVAGVRKATGPTAAPTATQPAATPTALPTKTPEVVTGLEKALDFVLSDGAPAGPGDLCVESWAGGGVPAIAGHGRIAGVAHGGLVHTEDDGVVCLYGIPTGGELAVDLFAPGGELAGSGVFRVQPDAQGTARIYQIYPELSGPAFGVGPELAGEPVVGSAQAVAGLDVVSISVWLPAGLPGGEWRVAARWLGGRVEAPFLVVEPTRAIVNPMPNGPIDPFRAYRAAIHTYVQGTEILLRGAAFPANTRFPLGLYHVKEDGVDGRQRGLLAHGVMVQTDGKGGFSTVVQTGGLQPGTYMIVSNPRGTDYGQGLSFFELAE
jgi:hypothetical protein